MGMVAPQQRIASAYFVVFGKYGDVSRYAEERGVCRQWVYREADWVKRVLDERQEEVTRLRTRLGQLEHQHCRLQQSLAQAVVLDEAKQADR